MTGPEISNPRKADVARRQLGTALHLYLAKLDPVSVHVLASGGGEIANRLAKNAKAKPFEAFTLEVHPDLKPQALKKIRNKHWNAMKHADDLKGKARDDEALLSEPLESQNAARLAEAWYDLLMTGTPQPIEGHTFIVWYFAKHDNDDDGDNWVHDIFPNLRELPEQRQHQMLLDKIEELKADNEMMADPLIDPRPLILPA